MKQLYRLLCAISVSLEYDCLIDDVKTWHTLIQKPYDRIEVHHNDKLEMLYSICVLLFGDYGTSPRSGWIENVEAFHLFINDIIKGCEYSE